jgi:hypothetical protein
MAMLFATEFLSSGHVFMFLTDSSFPEEAMMIKGEK